MLAPWQDPKTSETLLIGANVAVLSIPFGSFTEFTEFTYFLKQYYEEAHLDQDNDNDFKRAGILPFVLTEKSWFIRLHKSLDKMSGYQLEVRKVLYDTLREPALSRRTMMLRSRRRAVAIAKVIVAAILVAVFYYMAPPQILDAIVALRHGSPDVASAVASGSAGQYSCALVRQAGKDLASVPVGSPDCEATAYPLFRLILATAVYGTLWHVGAWIVRRLKEIKIEREVLGYTA